MALASSVRRKIKAKLKFLYQKSIQLISAFRRLLCNAVIQPHLCMIFMASSFKEKFQDQTSKNSKQIYLFLPKFPVETLYRSITYQKYKLRPARGRVEMFKPSFLKYSIYFKMAIGIPLQKTNLGQKGSSLFGPKNIVENKPQRLQQDSNPQPLSS